MSYLIILLVLAMALAPIMALKPSKKQKLQAQLRDKARQQGLQVQVSELPQTRRQQVRQEDTVSGVLYRLLWRHPQAKTQSFSFLFHREEDQLPPLPATIQDALQETLQAVPPSVLAIGFDNNGVAAYWQEEGDEMSVEQIGQAMTALKVRLESIRF